MADWRASTPTSLRFDNIDRIKIALETAGDHSAPSKAFSLESEIYKNSDSRIEYDAKCSALTDGEQEDRTVRQADRPGAGQIIGPYQDCHLVGEGVTSQVFRAEGRALKVIVETHKMEPHDPVRESRILETLERPCIPLLETFRDQEQRLVLVFPFMPLSLAALLDRGKALELQTARSIFVDIFRALEQIHSRGIIHRDIKPSAILLEAPEGPAYLSDFGTAWHPSMSLAAEPAADKILDIGTGPYRAPEVLFGDRAYGTPVDMWAAGVMLAECCQRPNPQPLFDSPPTHEDGSQLGLILSIFKTIGSPTKETWPEATRFKTPPFEMYRAFEQRSWNEVLPEVDQDFRALIASLIRYDGSRATAPEALAHSCMVTRT